MASPITDDRAIPDKIDVQAVNSAENRSLYASRTKIHPKKAVGFYRNLKWIIMGVTLGVYYLLPWIRWDRGPFAPDQAVLLDLDKGRFYFFFIEIWPQEIYYVTGLLIIAALALFLFTALVGRVWCGYACPQTVWTDLFVAVERWVEGDRNARLRLEKASWTLDKIFKMLIKNVLWLLIALGTGGAWVFYFADAPTLFIDLLTLDAPFVAYSTVGVLTFTTFFFGGYAREQICTYACPWPRIQGAMMDDQSIIVSYHPARGEPRGPHKKGATWDGRGHCVDCNQCVAVCPMGIDIRDGNQLECINCALCIDACDGIMDKLNLRRGLISYDLQANCSSQKGADRIPFKPFRTRTVLYAFAIALVGCIMVYGLITRMPFDLNILHKRNPAFVTLSNGDIRNTYTIKVLNKRRDDGLFALTIEGLEGATVALVEETDFKNYVLLDSDPDTVAAHDILVRAPKSSLTDTTQPITFVLQDEGGTLKVSDNSSFMGPKK